MKRNIVSGSILILVLWALFFLAAISIAIAGYISSGIILASHVQNKAKTDIAAIAGIEKAIVEILAHYTNGWDGIQNLAWNCDKTTFTGTLKQGIFNVMYKEFVSEDEVMDRTGVIGEESRININKASREILLALFYRIGLKGDVETLAGAIIERRDNPGFASDKELKEEKNKMSKRGYADISEIMELPGTTPEILEKLAPWITVFGSGKININSASPLVIAALADGILGAKSDVHTLLAQKISVFRHSGRCFALLDESSLINELSNFIHLTSEEKMVFTAIMPYLTISSTCFRGCSVGKLFNEGKEESYIDFVFDTELHKMLFIREK